MRPDADQQRKSDGTCGYLPPNPGFYEALYDTKFSPDQPRVPAGNPSGGQWTGGQASGGPSFVQEANTRNKLPNLGDGVVMNDAAPDPIFPGSGYAAQISIDASGLTGISTIDESTKGLANTLGATLDVVDRIPSMSAQQYGTAVHYAFGAAVRLQSAMGRGNFEVETSFGASGEATYGAKGSIRTDVILRNDIGDVIAIYDVKTGEAGLSQSRVRELRAKVGVGLNVPIIQLSLRSGVSIKSWALRTRDFVMVRRV
jgi:hypothetical protein